MSKCLSIKIEFDRDDVNGELEKDEMFSKDEWDMLLKGGYFDDVMDEMKDDIYAGCFSGLSGYTDQILEARDSYWEDHGRFKCYFCEERFDISEVAEETKWGRTRFICKECNHKREAEKNKEGDRVK